MLFLYNSPILFLHTYCLFQRTLDEENIVDILANMSNIYVIIGVEF